MDRTKDIQEWAYFKWLDSGCPEGQDVDIWLNAEKEYLNEMGFTKTQEGFYDYWIGEAFLWGTGT